MRGAADASAGFFPLCVYGDIALVNTEVSHFIQGGLKGAITRATFDDHMKKYRLITQNQDPKSRMGPGGVVQMVSNIMYHDPSIRQDTGSGWRSVEDPI